MLAAAGRVRQILQEEGVHRALRPHVQVRYLAFRQGDDAHAREPQALEQPAMSSCSRQGRRRTRDVRALRPSLQAFDRH